MQKLNSEYFNLSINKQLDITNGRPSGFDYLRLILASGVIFAHSFLLTGSLQNYPYFIHLLVYSIVPMFFALSGFLVAGSIERTKSLTEFFFNRFARIAPALSVEVLLSALIIGPLFTTYPLISYFTDPTFYSYFWNILGHIQYYLPGVFKNNPNNLINGQLWTVPYELVCYIMIALIVIFDGYRKIYVIVTLLIFGNLLQISNMYFRPNYDYQGATGSTVVVAFLAGVTIFRLRNLIPYSKILFIVAIFSYIAIMSINNGMKIAVIPIAYITIYIGLLNPRRSAIFLSGDYSYGIFLFGYPIQQSLIVIAPFARTWYGNFLSGMILTSFFAVASWWLIEKPVLSKKREMFAFLNSKLQLNRSKNLSVTDRAPSDKIGF